MITTPAIYKSLIRDIKHKATKNNITVISSDEKLVYDKGDPEGCAGFFSGHTRTLAYSMHGKISEVMGLLIHESCHMDQMLDDPFLWEKCAPGHNRFFEWLISDEIVPENILKEWVDDVIRLEKDCEERSVEKILKYSLPIDVKWYIQRANTYLFAYRLFAEKRKFINRLYGEKYVYANASTMFKKNYDVIPVRLRRAFEKRIKELKNNYEY